MYKRDNNPKKKLDEKIHEVSFYCYVFCNPIKLIDPTGEIPLLAAVGLAAGAVLVAGMVLNTILHFKNAKKIWAGLFQTNPNK